jgi:hypothetical protein
LSRYSSAHEESSGPVATPVISVGAEMRASSAGVPISAKGGPGSAMTVRLSGSDVVLTPELSVAVAVND